MSSLQITIFGKFIFALHKLIIDRGNTFTKVAVFEGDSLTALHTISRRPIPELGRLLHSFPPLASGIVSSVATDTKLLVEALNSMGINKVFWVRSGLRLPVRITYKTPETLGADRIANVCATRYRFPGQNCLVIDLGTCIKYDLVLADGTYPGGSISPGMKIRYKALHHFTEKLPLVEASIPGKFPVLTGQSTTASLHSGVEQGIRAELNGITESYLQQYKELKIIITGGDHSRFADKLKSPIFVAPNLTLEGLRVILDHNDG